MSKLPLDPLYPISTATSAFGLNHLQLVEKYLEAGIRLFQVRDKLSSDAALHQQLLQIKKLCQHSQADFLVNDRLDLALAAGAAGVHLGQTDLPVEAARRILGNDAIIGISSHTREQFMKAQLSDVDYVALGPIFTTTTKVSEYRPLGLDLLREIAEHKRHPLVAIGGIHLENARQVWQAGVDSVAVVSDVANHADPAARIRDYMDEWSRC